MTGMKIIVIYVLILDFMKDRERTVIIRKKGYRSQITAKRSRVQTGRAFRICDLVGLCFTYSSMFCGPGPMQPSRFVGFDE